MHILIITNYFEPESGAAAVRLTRLAKQLQAHGHQITVLTSLPNYPHGRIYEGYRRKFAVVRNYAGIRVIYTWLLTTTSPRINRKLISQMSFMLTAILRGIGLPRPDVLLIEAQPIFTGFAGIALAKLKRTPYVLNISDLWPDHLITV
ncbi:MAG TPA: glycosyltransferase, partial [Aggregatilineales bacterium]|nr:glycosyltransferase [Aggregatilineales bacterium]